MADKDGKNFKDLIQGVKPLKNSNKVYFRNNDNNFLDSRLRGNDEQRHGNDCLRGNAHPSEELYSSTSRHSRAGGNPESPENFHLSDNFLEDINSEDLFEHFHSSTNYKTIKALKSGKLAPEKTIDLHGFYQKDAKEIFIHEIQQCYDNGIKTLLFIHGKGRTQDQKPVLKNAIYHWAKQHPLILGFLSAPKNIGGAGATIIYLKKNKNI